MADKSKSRFFGRTEFPFIETGWIQLGIVRIKSFVLYILSIRCPRDTRK